jgi:hypothetical protein
MQRWVHGLIGGLAVVAATPAIASYGIDCEGAGTTPGVSMLVNGDMSIEWIEVRSKAGMVSSRAPGFSVSRFDFPAGIKADIVNRAGAVLAHVRLTRRGAPDYGFAGILLLAHRKYWLTCGDPG